MPELKVGDVNLHYDAYGAGEPLLMIMGLGASSAVWDPGVVQDLAKSFRAITFDNRGTGRSDKPDQPYSIEMFADDAAGVLDEPGIARAHIFGVSMGGMIAQESRRHPNRTGSLTPDFWQVDKLSAAAAGPLKLTAPRETSL